MSAHHVLDDLAAKFGFKSSEELHAARQIVLATLEPTTYADSGWEAAKAAWEVFHAEASRLTAQTETPTISVEVGQLIFTAATWDIAGDYHRSQYDLFNACEMAGQLTGALKWAISPHINRYLYVGLEAETKEMYAMAVVGYQSALHEARMSSVDVGHLFHGIAFGYHRLLGSGATGVEHLIRWRNRMLELAAQRLAHTPYAAGVERFQIDIAAGE